MIKIKRLKSPESLTKNWRKWNGEYAAAKTDQDRRRVEGRYRQNDVKTTLSIMFNEKCAYCESEIGVVDYGHIEHFRPKNKFPERIFLWNNLLLACTKCNSVEFKGTKFPAKQEGGPLVNPCVDDPAKHFAFQYNVKTKEARVVPLTERGEVTEKLLGLNRSKLLAARSDRLRMLMYIRAKAEDDNEAKDLIKKVLSSKAPYMAFVGKYIEPLK